jgi:hypothetical protein
MGSEEERLKEEIRVKGEEAFAKIESQRETTAKQFNPKELATRNRQLFTKTHWHFGVITYGKITLEDIDEMNGELEKLGVKDQPKSSVRSLMYLWKMLQKGCQDLTFEDVRFGYSFDEVSELMSFLMDDSFFLKAKPGPAATQKT